MSSSLSSLSTSSSVSGRIFPGSIGGALPAVPPLLMDDMSTTDHQPKRHSEPADTHSSTTCHTTALIKLSGYLDKKRKMKMMSSWKRYWFVLEGRLLLYYRSKDEYEAISPCKGSISLGPPCTIRAFPTLVGAFQIQTRASAVTLRAENTSEQKRWMHSLLSALHYHNQDSMAVRQQSYSMTSSKSKLCHFRYSLDELTPSKQTLPNSCPHGVRLRMDRQNSMPHRLNKSMDKCALLHQRLQRMSTQTYGGSLNIVVNGGGSSSAKSKSKVATGASKLKRSLSKLSLFQTTGSGDKKETMKKCSAESADEDSTYAEVDHHINGGGDDSNASMTRLKRFRERFMWHERKSVKKSASFMRKMWAAGKLHHARRDAEKFNEQHEVVLETSTKLMENDAEQPPELPPRTHHHQHRKCGSDMGRTSYDVPRSLLSTNDIDDGISKTNDGCAAISICPDSLEVGVTLADCYTPSSYRCNEPSSSYTSHHYMFESTNGETMTAVAAHHDYAVITRGCKPLTRDHHEIFVDSLEECT